MELTITQKRENALLERTEVYFTISHENAGTPRRAEIRKAVAAAMGGQGGIVILDWARADYGRTATRGFAKVYTAKERALEIETHPVLVRNGLREAVKKAEAAPPAPQAPAPARGAEPPKKEAPKPESKPEAAKKEEAPARAEKKEAAPAKKEAPPAKKDAAPAKKEAPAKDGPSKEKKPAGKKEGK
jgi:small subunit ribosomal protein S24e